MDPDEILSLWKRLVPVKPVPKPFRSIDQEDLEYVYERDNDQISAGLPHRYEDCSYFSLMDPPVARYYLGGFLVLLVHEMEAIEKRKHCLIPTLWTPGLFRFLHEGENIRWIRSDEQARVLILSITRGYRSYKDLLDLDPDEVETLDQLITGLSQDRS